MFVCVFNRNRDNYEVALALAERDLLTCLVTDYYSRPGLFRTLRPSLSRRKRDGIPPDKVRAVLTAFLPQVACEALGRPIDRVVEFVCGRLVANAESIARQKQSHVLAYAGNLPRRYAKERPDRATLLFQFHPNGTLTRSILENDFRCHPEAEWSMETEVDAQREQRSLQGHDWRYASGIICASSFTKRSLMAAGCSEEAITVIPYGIDIIPRTDIAMSTSARTRFLFVGQGIQRKGLHHLAAAWRRAGIKNAELHVVAYKLDPGFVPLLNQDNIFLHPYLPAAELARQFQHADIFVMPSLIEGFGLAYLEALGQGCHVIGTPNSGLPDLNLSADAVTLVGAGNIQELTEALKAVHFKRQANRISRHAIIAEASKWPWSRFRAEIGRVAELSARHAETMSIRP